MSDNLLVTEKVSDIHDLEPLKESWNALLEENATKTIELSYEWQTAYYKNFYQNMELYVLVAKENDDVLGVAPLTLVRKKFFSGYVRRLEFIAAGESNYQDFIVGRNNENIRNCILEYLFDHVDDWDILNLKHIPEDSPTFTLIKHHPRASMFFSKIEVDRCIYLAPEIPWGEHKKSLGKNRKHRMANRVRRLERELGPVQLIHAATEDSFWTGLNHFFYLHRKRWQNTPTPSQFLDARYRNFYSEAGYLLWLKGQFTLTSLIAGETITASLISFSYQDSILIQLIAYEPDAYAYSPMLVLQELLVDELFNQTSVATIDWGTYYEWKELWANQLKSRAELSLYPKNTLSVILYFFESVIAWVKTCYHQSIWMKKIFQVIQKIIRSSRNLHKKENTSTSL